MKKISDRRKIENEGGSPVSNYQSNKAKKTRIISAGIEINGEEENRRRSEEASMKKTAIEEAAQTT